jgi:hypothetical protein
VRQLVDGGQPLPVAETLAPGVGVAVDLPESHFASSSAEGQRPDLLAIDDQVPDGIGSRLAGRRRRRRRGRCGARRRGLCSALSLEARVVEDPRLLLIEPRRVPLTRRRLALDDDDVAALLALDLEDLAPDLLVRDRVLGRAVVTDNLHRGSSRRQASGGKSL